MPLVRGGVIANRLYSVSNKGWKRLASLEMYPRTTLLSVQKYLGAQPYFNSFCRKALIFVDTTVEVSSSLGTATGFNGVARDLAITREQSTFC